MTREFMKKGRAVRAIAGIGLWLAAAIIGPAPSPAAANGAPRYIGVNLSGAEYGGRKLPGKLYTDYVYPPPELMDYFLDRGMNSFRLPFRWERVQPVPGGALNPDELAHIDAVIAHVGKRGGSLILDPHNSARHAGKVIGSPELPASDFADLWRRLAERYRSNRHVVFGLMNEPHAIDTGLWFAAAQDAIDAIRETGATNLILVPGTRWSGAHSWFSGGAASNAAHFEALKDPGGNMAVELHQYLDGNSSGTGATCPKATMGSDALSGVTAWLRRRGYRGYLGEFGASADPLCLKALDNMLDHIDRNRDVWLGWAYWAGGPWLGRYPLSVSPRREGDTPQMRVLMKYVGSK